MKDSEIIKALECCACMDNNYCVHCPLYTDTSNKCSLVLMKNALDLINRQKAEIERLERILTTRCEHCPRDNTTLVKEVAERLIDLIYEADDVNPVNEWQIRNLVKETVGEE